MLSCIDYNAEHFFFVSSSKILLSTRIRFAESIVVFKVIIENLVFETLRAGSRSFLKTLF